MIEDFIAFCLRNYKADDSFYTLLDRYPQQQELWDNYSMFKVEDAFLKVFFYCEECEDLLLQGYGPQECSCDY